MLEGSHNMTCTVLFSRFDQFRVNTLVLFIGSSIIEVNACNCMDGAVAGHSDG